MVGVAVIVVVLVVVGPVLVFVAGALWSAVMGWFSSTEAEQRAGEDSEYVRYRSW